MNALRKNIKGIIIGVSALLLAIIIGIASFSFAKYTNSDNDSNNATVGKWGYSITVNADNLFGKAYGDKNANNLVSVKANGTDIVTTAQTNVVAPGATGSMTISVSGNAEVYASLAVTVTAQDIELNQTGGSKYNPIKWTLSDGSSNLFEDVSTADLQTKFAQLNQTFAANTTVNKNYTLTWEWAFTGNDANDTILGKIAAGETVDGYSANTTLSVEITVAIEQIQA